MRVFSSPSGLCFAIVTAAGLIASPVVHAADVSEGTALRHSGQIHTHKGHHAKSRASKAAKPNGTTESGAAQPGSETPPR